jgi:NAD(P)H dehydrogenase (quinone)
MSILVTGATGNLGRLVIASLLRHGTPASDVIAAARTPEKAADLGVPVVELDYTKPETIAAALDGVDSVLLISGSEVGQRFAQHSAVINAARAAGVKHLVYTSAPSARTSALILAPEHKATEEAIEASGIPATILRNGWYNENYLGTFAQAKATGEVVTSTAGGTVSSAARKDYADAAAVVLLDPATHTGKVYELSGDTAWDFDEFAATAAEVLGTPVVHRSVTPDEHATALGAVGLDAGTIGFLVGLDANIRDGLLGHTPGDLGRLIGRPTTPIADTLIEAHNSSAES